MHISSFVSHDHIVTYGNEHENAMTILTL